MTHSLTLKELENVTTSIDSINEEVTLLKRSQEYMALVKQKLSDAPLKHCEQLLTSAVQTVFGRPYRVVYSEETERFVLDNGEFKADIVTAEGGGLISLISFVLNVYLILKTNSRRILIYDEQFTNVSIEFYEQFIGFMKYIVKELGFSILMVTHDVRLKDELADTVYFVKDGVTVKSK